ncbi:hydantoinase B/oxoprolinase family protein [Haloplanus pelagicus]|uniref:hydantoinase B/oxoprolinase family protein n=1 Tax=Haloplanus pelagicus TaxID=2949995 RepID=UPI00203EA4A1|nr:hydantoinase B/oxoprolinase family protein [Haloplanus sp. HW8-1]
MSDVDAATVEVIRNYLSSAANEMQRTLIRTSYNTIIYEILDFGISLYDADMNLVADSPGLTMFLGANDYGLKKGVEYVGEENLDPGDIVIMNYPYWSSAHTLDVCLFSPIYSGDEHVGYAVIRAHWLDLGAKESGYVIDSTDMHQEGLVFPGTKIYKGGEPDEEIFELLRYNSRTPKKVIGDVNAQIAALNTGKRRVQELHEKYGSSTVDAAIDRILQHGRRTAKEGVADLPDGTWSAVDFLDNDGITDDLVRMDVEVTVDGEEFTVDFSGSSDEVAGPVNLPYGMTETVCKLVLKTLTTPDEPSNAGQYEPLSVVAPEGNLFHATYPAPTFTIWTGILGVEVVYKAVAKGMPDRVPASSGGDLCGIVLVAEDPETGEMFIESSNEGVGWGATDGMDGANALMHISETRVQNIPIEVFENKVPIRFDELTLRQDSGGIGEFRGGLGVRRDYRFLDDVKGITLIKKTRTEGWGLDGGEPGERNVVVVESNGEEGWRDRFDFLVDNDADYDPDPDEQYTGMMQGWFEAGEVLSNRSGGGGGYGDPLDRDPEAVRDDVRNGYVSRESARDDYGVVVTEDGSIDWEATRALRGE